MNNNRDGIKHILVCFPAASYVTMLISTCKVIGIRYAVLRTRKRLSFRKFLRVTFLTLPIAALFH